MSHANNPLGHRQHHHTRPLTDVQLAGDGLRLAALLAFCLLIPSNWTQHDLLPPERYLCDVFVLPEHRGKGLSKALMNSVMSHPDLMHLPVFLLSTRDAHGLYQRFGFRPLAIPENMMKRSM